jgi:desulfoferrodoxin-like iron-binding protein
VQEKGHVYKCKKCEKIVTILKKGEGELICCGEKMDEVTPEDARHLTFGMQAPGTP